MFSQALLLLKRKRYEESTRGQVEVYIDKIEQMIRSLEMAQLNVEVAERLRQGNEAMKKINEVKLHILILRNLFWFLVYFNRRSGANIG